MAFSPDDQPGARPRIPLRGAARRHVPQEVWQPYYEEVRKSYIDDKYPLQQLMGHMRRQFGFDASKKQWKAQLKIWGLAKNMSMQDAAHILRSYNEAPSNVRRQVYWYGKYKSRGEILKYIRKSKTLISPDDLLNRMPVANKLPSHITFDDLPIPDPQPVSIPVPSQSVLI